MANIIHIKQHKNIFCTDTVYCLFYMQEFIHCIGNILPFQNIFKDKKVFNEKLEYTNLSTYNKGVKLLLKNNNIVPIIKSGIVIFVGDKENMGKTVIINGSDGIDIWYGNLSNINVKLYDYVEENQLLGEAKDNQLYMLFQRDGVEVDYKEVLK